MSAHTNGFQQVLATLVCGALFGFGLALSTMIQPEVVLQFLRFENYGLMLVMGGAVLVTVVAYKGLPRLTTTPLLGGQFQQHASQWNRDTAIGEAIFGLGWGLCGVCPGPAIAALGAGNWDLVYALVGIAVGALLQGVTTRG